MASKKKVKTRLYLNGNQIGAIAFLQKFKDFESMSPQNILKTCLMIVAIDLRTKLESAAKEKEADDKSES